MATWKVDRRQLGAGEVACHRRMTGLGSENSPTKTSSWGGFSLPSFVTLPAAAIRNAPWYVLKSLRFIY